MPPQDTQYLQNNQSSYSTQPAKPKRNFVSIAIIVFLVIAFVGSLAFGLWSFGNMQDYKNNSDQKSEAAVQAAKQEQQKLLEAKFAEAEKEPLKSYTSPAQYGSVKIMYPKTWSAYIAESNSGGGTVVDGYFYPDFVPNTSNNDKTNFALRLQETSNTYKSVLDEYKTRVTQGTLKSSAFKPALVSGATVGVKMDGQITSTKKGSIVILPLRDKVLKIWTENEANINDFNNFVLKNLTYSP